MRKLWTVTIILFLISFVHFHCGQGGTGTITGVTGGDGGGYGSKENVAGAADHNTAQTTNELLGSWTYDIDEISGTLIITFYADGSGMMEISYFDPTTYQLISETESFFYSVSGNSLTIDGETVTYSISGNTLTITDDEGFTTILTRVLA